MVSTQEPELCKPEMVTPPSKIKVKQTEINLVGRCSVCVKTEASGSFGVQGDTGAAAVGDG